MLAAKNMIFLGTHPTLTHVLLRCVVGDVVVVVVEWDLNNRGKRNRKVNKRKKNRRQKHTHAHTKEEGRRQNQAKQEKNNSS